MCGIAGIAAFRNVPDSFPERLRAMCAAMVHRGPDDEGMDIRGAVALGMRRLSIIDLSGGSQPIFNEDKTVRTVFNGEIYNFRELRSDLEGRGHVFHTNTDTEVIVHAYEEYGPDFPRHFNGMFAFALHDEARHRLLLVRDQIGIKPLYYAFTADHLIFGSEIKTILASGLLAAKSLDLDALGEFLAWEYVPGEGTLLREVRKLEPGRMLEVDLRTPMCAPRTFWDVPSGPEDHSLKPEQWEEAVDAAIQTCVRRQLVSDVPLGAFLSGGVDSSLVVAAMGKARTFSIGFDDPSYNELPWARQVAEHLGVDHSDEVIRPDIEELFHQLMYFMDDPIGDFSIFPTYLVSRLARKHVTVALSGDGGDEIFGGYETYVAQNMARRYAMLPGFLRRGVVEPLAGAIRPRPQKKGLVNKAKRFLEGMGHSEELGHARWRIFLGEEPRAALFSADARSRMHRPVGAHILDLFKRAGERQPINRCLYVDLKSYLCDNCLVKTDRMSMAVSLEARVPFLDTELVELAFSMPDALKVDRGTTKTLLKRVAARHIPREAVYRSKQGFSIPIKNWLGTTLRPLMEELLAARRIAAQGLFNAATIERLKQEHLSGQANHSHVLWSLMVFQAWHGQWLEG